MKGRWIGHWFEWACPGCGCMCTALQAPADGDPKCGTCRAEETYREAMQALVVRVEAERDDWRGRALSAERALRAAERELANLKGAAA